jgi:uncharacterized protein YdhG (YjbR/CyaY superfamily)
MSSWLPWRTRVRRLRAAIIAANDELTEHVKWTAPSFCARGSTG